MMDAAHELGLRGVEERHPLLDRAGEHPLEERGLHLLLAEQSVLHRLDGGWQHGLRHRGGDRCGSVDFWEDGEGLGEHDVDLARHGDELVVTVKAVEWHLSHVYRKLGISSRTFLPSMLGVSA